jgi:hypothetical protein
LALHFKSAIEQLIADKKPAAFRRRLAFVNAACRGALVSIARAKFMHRQGNSFRLSSFPPKQIISTHAGTGCLFCRAMGFTGGLAVAQRIWIERKLKKEK